MLKTARYCLQVLDIMRNSEYTLDYGSEDELRKAYKRYDKDTDYSIIGMYTMLVEIREIKKEDLLCNCM